MLPISDFRIVKNKNNSFNLIGKIKVKVVLAIAILVISLFFTQLVFANGLSTGGLRLAEIEDDIKKLEAENRILKNQIANESSLATLSAEAGDLGFKNYLQATTP